MKNKRFWYLKYLPVKDSVLIMNAEFDGKINRTISKELVSLVIYQNMLLENTNGLQTWEYMLEHYPASLNWFMEKILSLRCVGEEWRNKFGIELIGKKLVIVNA